MTQAPGAHGVSFERLLPFRSVDSIRFDTHQHVLTEVGARTNKHVFDSFKTLPKKTRRPLMLILSVSPGPVPHGS